MSARGIANDGVDNDAFLGDVILELYRVLKQGTHLYWFTRWDKVKAQQPLLERYFTVKNSLIWDKNGVSMGDLKGAYASSYPPPRPPWRMGGKPLKLTYQILKSQLPEITSPLRFGKR